MSHSHSPRLGPQFLTPGAFPRAPWVTLPSGNWLLPEKTKRVPFMTWSHTIASIIFYLVETKSLTSTHTQGKSDQVLPFEGRSRYSCGDIYKPLPLWWAAPELFCPLPPHTLLCISSFLCSLSLFLSPFPFFFFSIIRSPGFPPVWQNSLSPQKAKFISKSF